MNAVADIRVNALLDRGAAAVGAKIPQGLGTVVDLRQHLQGMRQAWQNSKWDTAIAEADAVLAVSPNHLTALKTRLRAAINSETAEKIVRCAVSAAEFHPDTAFAAAKKLTAVQDVEGAAKVLVAIGPENGRRILGFDEAAMRSGAHLAKLVAGLEGSGDQERFRSLLRLGTAVAPENLLLRGRMASLRYALIAHARTFDPSSNPTAFVAAWEDVLSIDPNNGAALKYLAIAAEQRLDYTGAIFFWSRKLELDRADAVAAKRMARAAMRAGLENEALGCLHRNDLISLDIDHVAQLARRTYRAAKFALRSADVHQAAMLLVLLLRIEYMEDDLPKLFKRVSSMLSRELDTQRREKRVAEAAETADLLLKLEPENLKALVALGHHAYQSQAFAVAVDFYSRLVELQSDSSAYWLYLARARHKTGDLAKAGAAVVRSLELDPGNASGKKLQDILRMKQEA